MTRLILSLLGSATVALVHPVGVAQVPASESNQPSQSTGAAQTRSRPVLQIGSSGNAVTEVQGILKLLGYYTGAVDGLYEEATASAVVAFQEAAGLQVDGVVGPMTWRSLLPNPTTPAENPALASTTPGSPTPSQSPTSTPANRPSTTPASRQPAPGSPRPPVRPDPRNQLRRVTYPAVGNARTSDRILTKALASSRIFGWSGGRYLWG
ncbi:MAG: hypothetical protein HC881_00245 [Leptolyngbyaceae cyanobacterium SL_7_1]|nr:hypothetical protein [Leptolyngbyaceae cyanobacterium SL_7_1]